MKFVYLIFKQSSGVCVFGNGKLCLILRFIKDQSVERMRFEHLNKTCQNASFRYKMKLV